MYFNVQLYCLYVRVIWLPILCLLPNPFEFVWIGKFRIYIMDCGVGTGLLCFSCKKSVVVFTMWAKTEYSVRLAMQGNLWIKSFFYLKKKKKKILNPSDSIFRIHTREKEGVSWGKEFQELCKLVQAFSCFLFVNITKYYFCSLH